MMQLSSFFISENNVRTSKRTLEESLEFKCSYKKTYI